jgi:hypothetical protein
MALHETQAEVTSDPLARRTAGRSRCGPPPRRTTELHLSQYAELGKARGLAQFSVIGCLAYFTVTVPTVARSSVLPEESRTSPLMVYVPGGEAAVQA